MKDHVAIEMMQRCVEEIDTLRGRIAALEPKAHAYDSLAQVLRMVPQPSQGYGEDLAWKLRREIDNLKKQMVEPAAAETTAND